MTDSAGGARLDQPVLGPVPDLTERGGLLGRSARLVVLVVVGVVVAVAMAGWGYVMMSARGNPQALSQVITFELGGPGSITITFQVSKPEDRAAVCRLRAMDTRQAEVGAKDVTIPVGASTVQLTERLRTSAPAASGHVQYCYLVQ
ncbi:DUF4307 domain-containing protein [Sphaerisporangium aureirubrum]|uniref:DUF4307 domain-containing protein n=1 Tax=Sphaerisporangium aureirubrum TaxID=1544736 RepID=A0ABW1NGD6_9ACTN